MSNRAKWTVPSDENNNGEEKEVHQKMPWPTNKQRIIYHKSENSSKLISDNYSLINKLNFELPIRYQTKDLNELKYGRPSTLNIVFIAASNERTTHCIMLSSVVRRSGSSRAIINDKRFKLRDGIRTVSSGL